MGRRKIEIQPITNERNRAVTFLKRKQGLFKKAYELGVLCSVDVAVIIFERRQGSEKLFQYSSGDAQAIINKQARFEGERSLQGPADFNGSAPGGKGGAANDDDEDDEGDGEADELAAQPQPATPASSSAPAAPAPAKSKGKAKAPAPATSASRTTIKTESPTVTISNEVCLPSSIFKIFDPDHETIGASPAVAYRFVDAFSSVRAPSRLDLERTSRR
ncbi:SRF-like protein [Peniophora sp. CONT]|nr:SRF-like protein [Peniophora sp. CONT]